MRRLLAILLLLAANQAFAQSGRYAEISSVSVDTVNERRVTIKWDVAEVVNGQSFAVYHWENDKWVLIVDSLPANMREYQDVKAHQIGRARVRNRALCSFCCFVQRAGVSSAHYLRRWHRHSGGRHRAFSSRLGQS